MDVFISEEYVMRRRMEKKAASLAAAKGSSKSHSQARTEMEKNKNKNQSSDNAFFTSKGFSENAVFTCFSA